MILGIAREGLRTRRLPVHTLVRVVGELVLADDPVGIVCCARLVTGVVQVVGFSLVVGTEQTVLNDFLVPGRDRARS